MNDGGTAPDSRIHQRGPAQYGERFGRIETVPTGLETTKTLMRVATNTATVLIGFLATAGTAAFGAGNCGSLENGYGPYDYTNPVHREEQLPIVEKYHFTQKIQNMVISAPGSAIDDLDYTLRAFPNHHPALYAMLRLQLNSPVGPDSRYYTAECYVSRAITFAPTDPVPYMLFGIFKYQSGHLDAALKWYLDAYRLSPEWVELNYNLGLLYLELGDEEKAVSHAQFAYEHGYLLPGLKDKLIRKGLWSTPKSD